MEFCRLKIFQREVRAVTELGKALPIPLPLLYKSNLIHRVLSSVTLILLLFTAALGAGTTQIIDAKIVEVTERGFILQVGTDTLQVEDTGSTKFWKKKATAKRDAFTTAEPVTVRVKTNVDPPELKEMADRDSWKWLDGIRKQPQAGTVEKLDGGYLTLKFPDGSTFAYRATDKSKIDFKSKPGSKLADVEVGQKVYAKGRTLASLDTWLALLTDTPPATKPVKEKAAKKTAKPKALPASGKLSCYTIALLEKFRMFDVIDEAVTLHITYTDRTKFYLDGQAVKPTAIERNQKAEITYSRDKFGRIVASKVELFSH